MRKFSPDININSVEWPIIRTLESNNDEIVSTIKSINEIIRGLGKDYWNSPEKDSLDELFIPYMQDIEEKIGPYLKECTDLLESARVNYQQTQEKLNKKIISTIRQI